MADGRLASNPLERAVRDVLHEVTYNASDAQRHINAWKGYIDVACCQDQITITLISASVRNKQPSV